MRLRSSLVAVALVAAALLSTDADPARALDATATQIGAAPRSAALQVVLPLRIDDAGLKSFARAVSDPHSRRYGRYASVAQISGRFGATPSVRARVLSYLRTHGAREVKIDATGMLAEATITAGLAERLFATPLARYRARDGSRFIAPARTAGPLTAAAAAAPVAGTAIPPALRGLVDGVIGLDTQPLATHAAIARAARTGQSELPRSGTPAGCQAGQTAGEVGNDPTTAGFTPNQYTSAYDLPPQSASAGHGQRVALIEIDGFTASDITTFAQCFGLPVPPVNVFGVNISHPLAPGGEATLDLELLDAAAPGLSAIDVYESQRDTAHVLIALIAPLQNKGHKPQVVSASIGLCEQAQLSSSGVAGINAEERSLEAATAAGVTYLAASGDDGSADCLNPSGNPIDELAVNYPASSWWVTGVGGTNLSLTAANQISAQVVWNDTPDQEGAGGGGLSMLFNRPPYQDGIVKSNARSVPDVSMLADLVPGYAIFCTAHADCPSPWTSLGGTSAATPLLAGGVALIDQQLRAHGRQAIGFLNPLLYLLGSSRSRSQVFSDVIHGDNDVGASLPSGGGQPLGCCTAKPGYDQASGWGSIDIRRFGSAATRFVPYILGKIRLALPGHQRPVAHHKLLATVTCARACDTGAFARIKIDHKKPFEVDSMVRNLPHGGRKTIEIQFTRNQLSSLRSALAHHQAIEATIFAVNATPDGTIENQTRGQRLTIRS